MATIIPTVTPSGIKKRSDLETAKVGATSLEQLYALGRKQSLHKKEVLHGTRDDDRLIFLETGAAKLLANSHILAFQFPGDVVSILRSSSDEFALVALTDLECVTFRTRRLLDGASHNAETARHLLKQALKALHANRTQMMQLQHQSARQRLIELLVRIAQRIGKRTGGVWEFALPMTRGEIAASLGLTIETVSRQLSELRDAGLIETQGRSAFRVHDLKALSNYAECETK